MQAQRGTWQQLAVSRGNGGRCCEIKREMRTRTPAGQRWVEAAGWMRRSMLATEGRLLRPLQPSQAVSTCGQSTCSGSTAGRGGAGAEAGGAQNGAVHAREASRRQGQQKETLAYRAARAWPPGTHRRPQCPKQPQQLAASPRPREQRSAHAAVSVHGSPHLGHCPLGARHNGAAAMQGVLVDGAVGRHRPEQERVALPRLHLQGAEAGDGTARVGAGMGGGACFFLRCGAATPQQRLAGGQDQQPLPAPRWLHTP